VTASVTVTTSEPRVMFTAAGEPIPQGSKKAFRHSKTGAVVVLDDNPRLAGWRELVAFEARRAMAAGPVRLSGACLVFMRFYLPRPAGHYGTGRNAGTLRPSAPKWPAVKPDLDKLERAVLDSLTAAGVWSDDAVCCAAVGWKHYADDHPAGVFVSVAELGWAEEGL
jgi:Holliday junction resolvase RusA-like endonuclease